MSPQDEQWRRASLLCFFCILPFSCFTKYNRLHQNINKQNVNIADEILTDYSFLCRYHYAKSKNYLKRRYRIRHWIPMFFGTPCRYCNLWCRFRTVNWWPIENKFSRGHEASFFCFETENEFYNFSFLNGEHFFQFFVWKWTIKTKNYRFEKNSKRCPSVTVVIL